MKYICLGYLDENKWNGMSESEQNAFVDECFAYDDALRASGHFAGGDALDGASNTVTVRYRNGKAVVTDGPFAETREQLGGILVLEAADLSEAIQLISKHPGVRMGPFEVRPTVDLSEVVEESRQRRTAAR